MYYDYSCPYCGKVFYTYQDSREAAASVLFQGIKQHLVDYGEDHKEYQMDEGAETETDQMYYSMHESESEPSGDYKL